MNLKVIDDYWKKWEELQRTVPKDSARSLEMARDLAGLRKPLGFQTIVQDIPKREDYPRGIKGTIAYFRMRKANPLTRTEQIFHDRVLFTPHEDGIYVGFVDCPQVNVAKKFWNIFDDLERNRNLPI